MSSKTFIIIGLLVFICCCCVAGGIGGYYYYQETETPAKPTSETPTKAATPETQSSSSTSPATSPATSPEAAKAKSTLASAPVTPENPPPPKECTREDKVRYITGPNSLSKYLSQVADSIRITPWPTIVSGTTSDQTGTVACQAACKANPKCKAWTKHTGGPECYMVIGHDPTARTFDESYNSGTCS